MVPILVRWLIVTRFVSSPAEGDLKRSHHGGGRWFEYGETMLSVQMSSIPFFAWGFQVFSMILGTFF
jgi:hypothetical protein